LISNSYFNYAELNKIRFRGAKLLKINFHQAKLINDVNFNGTILKGYDDYEITSKGFSFEKTKGEISLFS